MGSRVTAVVLLGITLSMQFFLTAMVLASEPESYGSVTVGPDMLRPRFNHTATLLSDGRVLVCGGTSNGATSLPSAEVFDILTGRWSAAGDMSHPRMRHTASLLPSGEVLVAGGYIGGGHPSLIRHFSGPGNISLSSCELYDPYSGTFRLASPLEQGRFWHSAIGLPDGRVLVAGGLNVSGGALASCELYDPLRDSWETAGNMSKPRARFASGILPDGRVIVAGGHDGKAKAPFESVEIFAPATGLWTDAPPMNEARGYPGYAVVDGKFVVSGGFSGPSTPDRRTTEIYDPAIGEWAMGPDMGHTRHAHIIVPLENGEALTFGGSDWETGSCHSTLEVLDPSQTGWRDPYLSVQGRIWGQGCPLPDGRVLMTGGRACLESSGRTDVFALPTEAEDGPDQASLVLSILVLIALVVIVSIMVLYPLGGKGYGK